MIYLSLSRYTNGKLLFICLLVLLLCCGPNKEYPEDVLTCIQEMNDVDRNEVIKTIRHYRTFPADSLKLKALYFLVCNSGYFESFSSLQLRKGIDQAFESWSYSLQCSAIDFETFCEYILPMKISGEKFEDWRTSVHLKYDSMVAATTASNCDLANLVAVINDDVIKWFKFSNSEQNLTWSELAETQTGDCFSMAKILTFAARTYGVPVSIDFTPVWGNVNGLGHTWNTIVLSNGRSIPFMGAEKNPGIYNPFVLVTDRNKPENSTDRRCGKVFRRCYSIQRNNLEFAVIGKKGRNLIPGTLQGTQYKDVTREYMPVTDLNLKLVTQSPNFDFVFLSVLNYGEWIPVWWSHPDSSGQVAFEDMGRKIVYLPSYYSAEGIIPADYPRFIWDNGEIEILKPAKGVMTEISILHTQSIESDQIDVLRLGLEYNERESVQVEIGRNKNRSTVGEGDCYTLYYWDLGGWNISSSSVALNGSVDFKNVPSNSLYKITSKYSIGDERVFIVSSGKQIWL